jgi:hypothetical protein
LGAGNAAYRLPQQPAVDVFPCSDQPEIKKERFGDTKFGPALLLHEVGLITKWLMIL